MRWFVPCLLLWCVCFPAAGQAILEPPYGLHWGDSPEKLINWATRHSLDVAISLPGDQPQVRVVGISKKSGFLPGTRASAVEGRFLAGKLFELTVHYADPDASAAIMGARFEELRKEVGNQHGELRPNQQKREVADQFATRTKAFHREPVRGLFLMLAFTEVEDLLREKKEARFSLIYRNDNFRKEIETLLEKRE